MLKLVTTVSVVWQTAVLLLVRKHVRITLALLLMAGALIPPVSGVDLVAAAVENKELIVVVVVILMRLVVQD